LEAAQKTGPFVGITAYKREHREFFFSRHKERDHLLNLIRQTNYRVGVVSGEAGVGKTSLVNAAVMPQLQTAGFIPIYVSETVSFRRELEEAIMDGGATPSMPDEDLTSYLFRAGRSLDEKLVVIIDNISDFLEEEAAGTTCKDVVSLVRRIDKDKHPPIRLLLCIDTERYHLLTELEHQAEATIPPAFIYQLKKFDRETAASVIEQSALASGVYFEGGLSALMAQDMTTRGSVLPLVLQITLSRAVEKNALFTRRYLRQGGSTVLTLEWIKTRYQTAKARHALPLLSESADRRESEPGWATLEELALATGIDEKKAASSVKALVQNDLFQKREHGAIETYRLQQRGLIPLIHRIDGEYRSKTAKAKMTIRRRLTAGGALRPHETLSTLFYRPRSPEEGSLLSKSRKMNLLALFCVMVLLAGVFLWVQIKAQSGYRVELHGSGPMEHRIIVVKRGLPGYSRFALFSTSPSLGAVLVDTGIAGASLTSDGIRKIRKNRLRGSWSDKENRLPIWYKELLINLDPILRAQLFYLGGDKKRGQNLFKELKSQTKHLGRILTFFALSGEGTQQEKEMILSGMKSKNRRIQILALESALAIAEHRPEVMMDILTSDMVFSSVRYRKRVLEAAGNLPPKTAIELTLKIFDHLGETEIPAAVSVAERFQNNFPGKAAHILSQAIAVLPQKQNKKAVIVLRRLGNIKPQKTITALAKTLLSTKSTQAGSRLSKLLSDLYTEKAKSKIIDKAVLSLLKSDDFESASVGARLAGGTLKYTQTKKVIASMTNRDDSNDSRWKILAAKILGKYAQKKEDIDTDLLKSLASDSSSEVRVEAIKALGKSEGQRVFLTNALSDRDAKVRAEAMVGLAAQSGKNNYKTLTLLRRLTKKETLPVKLAMPRAAAKLVTSRKYWSIARYEIIGPTKDRSRLIRGSAVNALAEVAHIRPKRALSALQPRMEDKSPAVRKSTVRAFRNLAPIAPKESIEALLKLSNDNNHKVAITAMEALRDILKGDHKKDFDKLQRGKKGERISSGELKKTAQENIKSSLVSLFEEPADSKERIYALLQLTALMPSAQLPKQLESKMAHIIRTVPWEETHHRILLIATSKAMSKPLYAAIEACSPELKRTALKSAMKHSPKTGAKAIIIALQEPDLDIQHLAFSLTSSLNLGKHPDITNVLIRRLEDPSDHFAFPALEVLAGAEHKDSSTRKRIKGAVTTSAYSPYVALRSAAAGALAKNPKGFKKLLSRLLKDPAVEVRRNAIIGYATSLSRKMSTKALGEWLDRKRSSRQERFAAALALNMSRKKDNDSEKLATKALRKAGTSKMPLTRVLAGAALKTRAGDTEKMMNLLELLFLP